MGVGLIFPFSGNPPIFGIGFEVPNTRAPAVAVFSWNWRDYVSTYPNSLPITIQLQIPSSGISGAGLDYVKSVFIDNSNNYTPVKILPKDTQVGVICAPLRSGWFPITTNQFNFDVTTYAPISNDVPDIGVTASTAITIAFSNTVIPPDTIDNQTNYDIIYELQKLDTDLIGFDNSNWTKLSDIDTNLKNFSTQNNTNLGNIWGSINYLSAYSITSKTNLLYSENPIVLPKASVGTYVYMSDPIIPPNSDQLVIKDFWFDLFSHPTNIWEEVALTISDMAGTYIYNFKYVPSGLNVVALSSPATTYAKYRLVDVKNMKINIPNTSAFYIGLAKSGVDSIDQYVYCGAGINLSAI